MMNPSNQFGLSNELAQAIRLLYLEAENPQISNEIYTETLKNFGYKSVSLYLRRDNWWIWKKNSLICILILVKHLLETKTPANLQATFLSYLTYRCNTKIQHVLNN